MANNPLILAVDTSLQNVSVALVNYDIDRPDVLASIDLNNKITHSQQLIDCIHWVLKNTSKQCKDLDGFAIGLGPGSFTGLRIGMSTMKGLAVASKKPLVGVSTLDTIASNCQTDRIICVIMDARKKEVYSACYQYSGNGELVQISDTIAIDPIRLLVDIKKINKPILLVGDGIPAYLEVFSNLDKDFKIASSQLHFPNAKALALNAGKKFLEGDLLDLTRAVPLYIRKSDAELMLNRA